MLSGLCVFIDHASGYVSINYQVALNATETIKAKSPLRREAKSQGVVIKRYHTDNGIFNASEFMEELLNNQQKIRFSGSGASHQNGAAERAIKTVCNPTPDSYRKITFRSNLLTLIHIYVVIYLTTFLHPPYGCT